MTRRSEWLTPQDEAVLASRGVTVDEALRQLRTLANPPGWAVLDRPCTLGDGLVSLGEDEVRSLESEYAPLAAAGRVRAFVPASGAATRMFKDLLALLARGGELEPSDVRAAAEAGDAEARAVVRWVDGLPRFAFHDALAGVLAARGLDAEALRARGPWRPLLAAALDGALPGSDPIDGYYEPDHYLSWATLF